MLMPVCAETRDSFVKRLLLAIRLICFDGEQENKKRMNVKIDSKLNIFIVSIYKSQVKVL